MRNGFKRHIPERRTDKYQIPKAADYRHPLCVQAEDTQNRNSGGIYMNDNLQNVCDKYMDYILEQLKNLLAIDSPTGYTGQVSEYLTTEYERLGYAHLRT